MSSMSSIKGRLIWQTSTIKIPVKEAWWIDCAPSEYVYPFPYVFCDELLGWLSFHGFESFKEPNENSVRFISNSEKRNGELVSTRTVLFDPSKLSLARLFQVRFGV